MSSLFQPSTLSFEDAKVLVAEQYSKQSTTGMLLRAGRAIQRAFMDWNKHDFEWNIVTAADIPVTAGVAEYPLPFDFRDMYSCVLTVNGATRALAADSLRGFLRVEPERTPGDPTAYTQLRRFSTGKLTLLTTPNTDGTISEINYYRRMVIPCAVTATGTWVEEDEQIAVTSGSLSGMFLGNEVRTTSTATFNPSPYAIVTSLDPRGLIIGLSTSAGADSAAAPGTAFTVGDGSLPLDIPEDYVWGLLARACEHFLIGVGAPEKLIGYWASAARAGLDEAHGSTNRQADRVVRFIPAHFAPLSNNNVVPE